MHSHSCSLYSSQACLVMCDVPVDSFHLPSIIPAFLKGCALRGPTLPSRPFFLSSFSLCLSFYPLALCFLTGFSPLVLSIPFLDYLGILLSGFCLTANCWSFSNLSLQPWSSTWTSEYPISHWLVHNHLKFSVPETQHIIFLPDRIIFPLYSLSKLMATSSYLVIQAKF